METRWITGSKGLGTINKSLRLNQGSDILRTPQPENDTRFSTNALVTSKSNSHFYAGGPDRIPTDETPGTPYILDIVLQELSAVQIELRPALASQAGTAL